MKNLSEYRKLFSDYQPGYSASLHILRKPIKPIPDPPLTDENRAYLLQLTQLCQKGYGKLVTVISSHAQYQAKVTTLLCYSLKRTLWLVDSVKLLQDEEQSPGSIHHLVAQAQSAQSILLFDEADSLLNSDMHNNDAQRPERFIHLAEQYAGLCLLSLDTVEDEIAPRLAEKVVLP